jgi:hypothetical protein
MSHTNLFYLAGIQNTQDHKKFSSECLKLLLVEIQCFKTQRVDHAHELKETIIKAICKLPKWCMLNIAKSATLSPNRAKADMP